MNSQNNKTEQPRGNSQIAELGRATRFQPGQSGNPGGRPSRTPYSDAHREVAQLKVHELGILPSDSVAVALAKSVASEALKGKISAAAEAANRAEGRPRQCADVSQQGPVEIRVRYDDPPAPQKAEQATDSLPPSDGDSKPE